MFVFRRLIGVVGEKTDGGGGVISGSFEVSFEVGVDKTWER